MNPKPVENVYLKWYAVFTAGLTFLLVWVGGMVTSKGYGLAVPDWPNTYGYNMFFFPASKWIGGVFFEHSHRLVASTVGFLTMILALWMYGRNARPLIRGAGILFIVSGLALCLPFPKHAPENISLAILGLIGFGASFVWPRCEPSPKWMRVMGVAAFIAVVTQGVLGGLRVVLVKADIGIFHAMLAQLFLVLMSAVALCQTKFWRNLPVQSQKDSGHFRHYFVAATCLVFCQLMIGATMRHAHAGLSIPDFPLAYGKIWPDTSRTAVNYYNESRMDVYGDNPITAFQVILQMVHRIVACFILIAVSVAAWRVTRFFGRRHALAKMTFFWLGLVLIQACLGAATIWTGKTADVATAHLACGALCLVTGGLISLLSFRILAPEFATREARQKNELTSVLTSSSISR